MNPVIMAILITGLLFGGMLAAFETGRRVGRARRAKNPTEGSEGGGAVEAAILGLLGLTLAFTFSAASERLLTRRAQIVHESNAIGTAYLRLDVLPASDQPALRDLFRRYLEARIEVFEKMPNLGASDAARVRGNALQREIWSRAVESTRNSTHPGASVIVLTALNEMIDITNTRNMAMRTHVPVLIIVLLVILALLGALLSGYAMSVQPRRSPLHMIVFALAITAMVYVVLDLEVPRFGMINLRATDQAMVQLRQLMK
jgi:hypothetical protein